MNFDTLPYEVQFKYLTKLSYNDTLSYCNTSSAAYKICKTDYFWKSKCKHNFNITLDVIDGKSPMSKYETLENFYYNSPGELCCILVENEDLEGLPNLIKQFTDSQDVPIYDMINMCVEKGSVLLLEDLLKILTSTINTKDKYDRFEAFRDAYFNSIIDQKQEITTILRRYYNPNLDYSEEIYITIYYWSAHSNLEILMLLEESGFSLDRFF